MLSPLVRPNEGRDGNGADVEERESKRRRTGDEDDRQEQAQEEAEEEDEESGASDGRRPAIACDPGRPTQQELLEHRCTHWPFRSWCRHCVRGRAMASPHRKKSAEAREFAEGGRVPTLSLDHCFLGSEEEAAAGNPFLIVYDDYSGA